MGSRKTMRTREGKMKERKGCGKGRGVGNSNSTERDILYD